MVMNRAQKRKAAKLGLVPTPKLLKLDLGCGKNKREGFHGVDCREFKGVDQVVNLVAPYTPSRLEEEFGTGLPRPQYAPWPWDTATVEEAHSSHFVEHLTAAERIHFVNELYRVLIDGGKCTLITPHWASCRAYGDLTHQWPPVSEFWYYYLLKSWREANAPHNDAYTCDFDVTWGYALRPDLAVRNEEFQQFALANYKEAATDLIATLVKRPPADG